MVPRAQTAGTAGIVAGIALIVLFILFMTSGASPDTFADPAKALPFLTRSLGLFRLAAIAGIIVIAAVVPFVAGFAGALRDRAPTRATCVLYFALIGLVGHAFGLFQFFSAVPLLTAFAATDQVAAAHAWVALNLTTGATDAMGNLFIGLSTLVAGWAVVATGVFGVTLGWYGVITGIVAILVVLAPMVPILFMASFVLPAIWLIWAGNTLRGSSA